MKERKQKPETEEEKQLDQHFLSLYYDLLLL